MLKKTCLSFLTFLVSVGIASASFLPEDKEKKEVTNLYRASFHSIDKEIAILSKLPNNPQKMAIGTLEFDDKSKSCLFSFRGALGMSELMNAITQSSAVSVNGIKSVKGKIHKGTSLLFDGMIESGLSNQIVEHLANSGKSFADYETRVQGYSIGSGVAWMTSAWLVEEMSAKKISLDTYAPLAFCDETAKGSFEENQNIVYLQYRAKQDKISSFFDKTFYLPGKMTEINADDSPTYTRNVKAGEFPHIEPSMLGFAKSGMANFLFGGNPFGEVWNAHMLDTFLDHPSLKLSTQNKITENTEQKNDKTE